MDKDDGGGADTAIKQLRVSPSDSQATPPWAGMAEVPQAERVFDRFGCVALVFYAAISVFVFARSLLSDFANSYVGQGPDPSAFMWLLVWWPHAISHRLNPFLTHDIFEPGGFNLGLGNEYSTREFAGEPAHNSFWTDCLIQRFDFAEPSPRGLDGLHLVPAHRAQLLAGAFGWLRLWLLSLHAQPDTWWAPGSGDGVVRPAGRLSRASLLRGHIQAHYIRGAHGINAAHPISPFGRSPGYYDRL